jgi:hypothetical protein
VTLLELLQAGDSSLAVLGSLLAAGFWLRSVRGKSIEDQYRFVPERWTNEGDIYGQETDYIDLELELVHGEVYGAFRTSEPDVEYNAYFTAGWPSGRLVVSAMQGRGLTRVAEYKVRLHGNNNRLKILAVRTISEPGFPARTTVWPVPKDAR